MRTGVLRRRTARPADPAAGFRLPATDEVVEARSVLETAALGFTSAVWCFAFPLNAYFVLPSPVWVRLVRERRAFERALLSPGNRRRLPSASVWPAVGAALLLWLIPPVPLAIQLTRLARMQPPGVGSARRTRTWLLPLATAVMALFILSVVSGPGRSFGWLAAAIHLTVFAMFTTAFAAVQHEHNAVAQHYGETLPADELVADGALPRTAYTPWGMRALAALIDACPILILVLFGGVGPFLLSTNCGQSQWECPLLVFASLPATILYSFVLTAVVVLIPTYVVWNWGYRQGRAGATVGKKKLKFRVISENTGASIGFRRAILRLFLNALSALVFGLIGFLLPLCDAKRRTLTDEMMSTVCVPTPAADSLEATRHP